MKIVNASTREPRTGLAEKLARRDRLIVLFAVALILLLAALYTLFGVGMNMTAIEMTRMARPVGMPLAMGMSPDWTVAYVVLIFFMWWIMMIAMMTPSAAPMLLLFTALKKRGPESKLAEMYSSYLLAGYLAVWAGFSVVAAGLQWTLEGVGLIEGAMMTIKSRLFAGALLLAAGLYQFSWLKNACLAHCRSPGQFLAEHHRPGLPGAFRIGVDHGFYCLGCCWALMVLLFVGGIMNLYWIVGLAIYVLLEKLVPRGDVVARVAGTGLAMAGLYFVAVGITNP